eukprot:TRINITY_DN1216_c0_g1_i1.p1 TRINITY_DN1216_c0_g1~~TRINITY_DN1216_c0_g1_i1.p1  ORF type:complete len:140 (-),score=19.22 TRINITY_DN1216_c0_g1_i1:43-408(-)
MVSLCYSSVVLFVILFCFLHDVTPSFPQTFYFTCRDSTSAVEGDKLLKWRVIAETITNKDFGRGGQYMETDDGLSAKISWFNTTSVTDFSMTLDRSTLVLSAKLETVDSVVHTYPNCTFGV